MIFHHHSIAAIARKGTALRAIAVVIKTASFQSLTSTHCTSPLPHFHSPTYPPRRQHRFPVQQWQTLSHQTKLAVCTISIHSSVRKLASQAIRRTPYNCYLSNCYLSSCSSSLESLFLISCTCLSPLGSVNRRTSISAILSIRVVFSQTLFSASDSCS